MNRAEQNRTRGVRMSCASSQFALEGNASTLGFPKQKIKKVTDFEVLHVAPCVAPRRRGTGTTKPRENVPVIVAAMLTRRGLVSTLAPVTLAGCDLLRSLGAPTPTAQLTGVRLSD